MGEVKLFEQGLEEYPLSGVIVGNVVMILWIVLGVVALQFIQPMAAWVYLFSAVAVVYVVLRGLVCSKCCYHGKRCALGWGVLSSLMFKKDCTQKFSTSWGIKIAPMVYGLLALVPIIALTYSMYLEYTATKLTILTLLILVFIYSGFISRGKACKQCKMKLICPGCAKK